MPAETAVEVRARRGHLTAPIGSLRLRRCWRGEPPAGRQPLVSVVIASPDGPERSEATTRSVGEQPYLPTEVLVALPPGAGESAPPSWEDQGIRAVAAPGDGADAIRNEAIRRSNGDLIAFVRAGAEMAPGGLARAVERLLGSREAAGLVDGLPGGRVAAAIYRRAAFEELGGFGQPGRACDEELARRAAAGYDVIFEPGTLIAGDGG
jgi:hypothetical protein